MIPVGSEVKVEYPIINDEKSLLINFVLKD